jgi:hypothetical protein
MLCQCELGSVIKSSMCGIEYALQLSDDNGIGGLRQHSSPAHEGVKGVVADTLSHSPTTFLICSE